jgi:hypothetical protein
MDVPVDPCPTHPGWFPGSIPRLPRGKAGRKMARPGIPRPRNLLDFLSLKM